jgi:hypothetical protein
MTASAKRQIHRGIKVRLSERDVIILSLIIFIPFIARQTEQREIHG